MLRPSRSSRPSTAPCDEREAVLRAQPAHQLAEHHPQLAGEQAGIDAVPTAPAYYIEKKANCQFACIMICVASASTQHGGTQRDGPPRAPPDRYKWIALSNTTLGVLLATLDASITLIAMPDIFRGIKLDPLVPANSFYLLWMMLGFLVVSSVLIVSLGRLGDMYGRVRIYNLGFVIYTVASLLLTIDWMTGRAGATLPDRVPHRPGRSARPSCWRTRRRSSPTRSPPTSAGWRSASTTSSASAACSSGSCSAACWRRSTGAWCS